MGVEVWKRRSTVASSPESESAEVAKSVVVEALDTGLPDELVVENMTFSVLASVVSTCQKCSLCESRTNTVFGTGSETADLMFIGEAPGADEDREGLPFVGKAGKLLTSMIAALGFKREEVYISNVLKCRPPGNRDPKPKEAKLCSPYLRRQIELISPKVIVALGRISAQLLLDTELPLFRLRREIHKFYDTDVDLIVTYHPAYLLRKPSEKSKAWEDLWEVQKRLN